MTTQNIAWLAIGTTLGVALSMVLQKKTEKYIGAMMNEDELRQTLRIVMNRYAEIKNYKAAAGIRDTLNGTNAFIPRMPETSGEATPTLTS